MNRYVDCKLLIDYITLRCGPRNYIGVADLTDLWTRSSRKSSYGFFGAVVTFEVVYTMRMYINIVVSACYA